ncbi:hypothetical protein BDN70DRAFT_977541, partial [Pholiota conissans]
LPPTVEAVRSGWKDTSQGGAVVSGLLAAVAAQLLSYFRSAATYSRRQDSQNAIDAVVALCYAALFFNIGATISAFIIVDKLGSLTLVSARRDSSSTKIGSFSGTETEILEHFGAGKNWKYIQWHWVICFYSGTICLTVLLLTFIWLQEAYWIGVLISLIGIFAFIPSLAVLIFAGGPGGGADSHKCTNASPERRPFLPSTMPVPISSRQIPSRLGSML